MNRFTDSRYLRTKPRRRPFLLLCTPLLLLLASTPAVSAATVPPLQLAPGDGWHEAMLVVSNLDHTRRFLIAVAGWIAYREGPIDDTHLAYFDLDRPGATGRYALMRSPDSSRGWVRLVEYRGLPSRMIRAHAQPWDTGGIFSLMTRSADARRNLADAEQLGWLAYSEPYDFRFGKLALRNVILRGPDGVNLAVYEWLEPRRDDLPIAGAVTHPFNSMQMVRDLATARRFYVEKLGFDVIAEGEFLDPAPRPTNFGLPLNYATRIPRAYCILVPGGADPAAGRVELMAFPGFQGRDLAGKVAAANRGILSLQFPVTHLDDILARLDSAGIQPVHGPGRLPLPPFGSVPAVTIATPDGAWLTWFEAPPDTGDPGW